MQIRFTPTYEEFVDLSVFAAQHPPRELQARSSWRSGWEGVVIVPVCSYLIAAAVVRVLPSVADGVFTVSRALGVAFVGLLVYFFWRLFWQRMRMRARYHTWLAGARPILERAGELSIALAPTGVEASDVLHQAFYPWKGIAAVTDSTRAVVIFPYMAGAIGVPYRAFDRPADVQAFRDLAKQHLAAAA